MEVIAPYWSTEGALTFQSHSLPGSGKCGASPAMAKAASGLLAQKKPLHDKRLARYKISPLSEVPGPDLGNCFP